MNAQSLYDRTENALSDMLEHIKELENEVKNLKERNRALKEGINDLHSELIEHVYHSK